jgi:hypothetical protein
MLNSRCFVLLLALLLGAGCFASAPAVDTAKPLPTGGGLLAGEFGPLAATMDSPELVLLSKAGEKTLYVEFSKGASESKEPQSFLVSLPPGRYEIKAWSFYSDGNKIEGGADLLPFDVNSGELVCLGYLFPVLARRGRESLRALATDANGCSRIARHATKGQLSSLPVRFAYSQAFQQKVSEGLTLQAGAAQSGDLPIVVTAHLGRYLRSGASMVDLLVPYVRLAHGVVTAPAKFLVRTCVTLDGHVNDVKILESSNHALDAPMEHELRSRPYEKLPMGSQASAFCYVDTVVTGVEK